MSTEIDGGWLKGHRISVARKRGRCEYNHGQSAGGRCQHIISVGEKYVQGEIRHNGIGQERYCLACAGPEARRAAERQEKVVAE